MFNSGIKCTVTSLAIIKNPGFSFLIIFRRFQGWSQRSSTHLKTIQKVYVGKQIGSVKKFEYQRNEKEKKLNLKFVRKATMSIFMLHTFIITSNLMFDFVFYDVRRISYDVVLI